MSQTCCFQQITLDVRVEKKVQKLFVFQLFLSYVKFYCTVFTRDAESGVLPLSFCFCINDVLILCGCGTSELQHAVRAGLLLQTVGDLDEFSVTARLLETYKWLCLCLVMINRRSSANILY